jgi:hypothetical protein
MGLSTGAAIGIAVGAMFVILFFVCVALRLAAVNSAAAGAEMESAADGLFAFGAMFGGGAGACMRACVRAYVRIFSSTFPRAAGWHVRVRAWVRDRGS